MLKPNIELVQRYLHSGVEKKEVKWTKLKIEIERRGRERVCEGAIFKLWWGLVNLRKKEEEEEY